MDRVVVLDAGVRALDAQPRDAHAVGVDVEQRATGERLREEARPARAIAPTSAGQGRIRWHHQHVVAAHPRAGTLVDALTRPRLLRAIREIQVGAVVDVDGLRADGPQRGPELGGRAHQGCPGQRSGRWARVAHRLRVRHDPAVTRASAQRAHGGVGESAVRRIALVANQRLKEERIVEGDLLGLDLVSIQLGTRSRAYRPIGVPRIDMVVARNAHLHKFARRLARRQGVPAAGPKLVEVGAGPRAYRSVQVPDVDVVIRTGDVDSGHVARRFAGRQGIPGGRPKAVQVGAGPGTDRAVSIPDVDMVVAGNAHPHDVAWRLARRQ
jgi:hypothetical protein